MIPLYCVIMKDYKRNAIELCYHFIVPHLITLRVCHAPGAYLRPFYVPVVTERATARAAHGSLR